MTSGRFANLAAAGRALAEKVGPAMAAPAWGAPSGAGEPLVLAVIPNGVPVALPVAEALGLQAEALRVVRSEAGVEVVDLPAVQGRIVIVIDDGVETGTVARAVVGPLREAGAARVILAVPVCSREVLLSLTPMYDEIIAVVTPFARRSLAWHFDDFDTIDDQTAQSLLLAP